MQTYMADRVYYVVIPIKWINSYFYARKQCKKLGSNSIRNLQTEQKENKNLFSLFFSLPTANHYSYSYSLCLSEKKTSLDPFFQPSLEQLLFFTMLNCL